MSSAPRCGQNESDRHDREEESMKLTTITNVSVDAAVGWLTGRPQYATAAADPGAHR